jgi:AraC-like DNA-binding protein
MRVETTSTRFLVSPLQAIWIPAGVAHRSMLTNVKAVALAVGFRSESAFIRSFAQYTGETPSAYRRRIRAQHVPSKTVRSSTAVFSSAYSLIDGPVLLPQPFE